MNTGFNVSLVGQIKKGMDIDNAMAYHVELGQDILDGLTDAEVRELARDAKVIALQGNIRRKEITRDKADEYLTKQGYGSATISDYTFAETKAPDNKKIKAIIANVLGIKVEDVTDAMVAKAKAI